MSKVYSERTEKHREALKSVRDELAIAGALKYHYCPHPPYYSRHSDPSGCGYC